MMNDEVIFPAWLTRVEIGGRDIILTTRDRWRVGDSNHDKSFESSGSGL